MLSSVVYPGTFDPITYGHIDIIQRASQLFDRVIVSIAQDTPKETLFSLPERVALARQALADVPRVTVRGFDGLLVNWMQSHDWRIIIRGIRWADDVHYEWKMAMINQNLAHDIETICLMARPKHGYITASTVRHIARLQGDVSQMVPPLVVEALHHKLRDIQKDRREGV